MIHFLVGILQLIFNDSINFDCFFLYIEETYWKPDVVDQQEVLVKVMDTYGKVLTNSLIKHILLFLLFKDDKRLPYYLKWADAVLITYSITQQDSFDMALAYLDAITNYSKSLSVSTNELVLMLLGNKLDLERIR
jgi:GTPase SAR1 family protein